MGTYRAPRILRFLRDYPPTHYSFEVNSFSMLVKMKQDKYESGVFGAGGYKWKMILYPEGNKEETHVKDHISLYLAIQDTDSLPETWEVNVDFNLFVYNQTQNKFLCFKDVDDPVKRFHNGRREWGFPKLFEHEAFKDPTNGYLVNDCCIFGADVFTGQPIKNPEYIPVKEDGQDYDFNSKMIASGGKYMRHFIPPSGSDLQNGPFRTFRDLKPSHFLMEIESFSSLCKQDSDVYESDIFECGGFKWRLCLLYPKENHKGNVEEGLSLYLRIVETKDLCKNWEVFATFTFFIHDQIKDRFLTLQDGSVKRFRELKKEWGFDNLISLKEFEDASNGFLVNDQCSFGTELIVVKHEAKIVKKLPAKTVEKSPAMAVPVVAKPIFVWKIENISKLAGEDIYSEALSKLAGVNIYSEAFNMGGFKWKLRVYRAGFESRLNTSMSVILHLLENEQLPKSLEVQVELKIRINDQLKSSHHECKTTQKFTSQNGCRGIWEFISLEKLNDESLGYKKDDAIIIELVSASFSMGEVVHKHNFLWGFCS